MFRFNLRNVEDIFVEFFGSVSLFGGIGGMGGRGGGMYGGFGSGDSMFCMIDGS